MNANPDSHSAPAANFPRQIKIIGIGTAGTLMVDQLPRGQFLGADFAFINTDSSAPVGPSRQLLLDTAPLRGLGTGGDAERGRKLAQANVEAIKSLCGQQDVVFLVAGLGGGAGSGVSPVVARAARDCGALTLAFVTLPFECEGNRRQQQAEDALHELQSVCDGVICLPNQKAFHLCDSTATVLETFRHTTQLLSEGLGGVWRLLVHRGMIELHFEDLCAVLREPHGESCFATVEAAGGDRPAAIAEKISAHPLLDGGQAFERAASLVVSILGGPDLAMADINQIMQDLNRRCPDARVIMGAAVDDQYTGRLLVTVFATRSRPSAEDKPVNVDQPESSAVFGAELIHPETVARPKARTVPPPPTLSAEQRAEIITRHTGKPARGRKKSGGPRMRQTTLPLDIVNKGRFDKSEPTIHKGEDLDLPTYVRRGISLN